MARLTHIKGLNTVLGNLRRAKNVVASGVGRGLKKGGLHLQRKSQEIVPVQLGNLKNTSFCRNVGGVGFDTDIVVGYTADYAVYVHENLDKLHGRAFNEEYAGEIAAAQGTRRGTAAGGMFNRGEDQQAKFLEQPARDERGPILKIIRDEARLG